MDIYDQLGVRKIINANATLTALGGSLMPLEVLQAMTEASRHFVEIDELQRKVGAQIAALTHNEAAYVSCGAAAGLVLSTAACIAGTDPEKRLSLPFTAGMKNEIIVHKCSRVGYDFAIRQAGGVLVEIGTETGATAQEMEAAVNERTAAVMVFYKDQLMQGQVPLSQQVEIAHQHTIPVVVDAAAQLPPVENLWRIHQMGADLVLFSGGKGLCGPQSSGLILGRQDLVEACAFHACPRPYVGRPMKAGKEEIVGLLAAVKWFLSLDHAQVLQTYEDQVAWVIQQMNAVPGVSASRSFPSEAGQPMPRAEICFNESLLKLNRDEILKSLFSGDPPISLAPSGSNGIFFNPQTVQPGQEKIIVNRLLAVLKNV
jgi:L-seryl-tRNA(Ser) seleniumtransferase